MSLCKGLLGRKTRAILTAVAIVIGVAMIGGTYILTDTIKAAFSTVFTRAYKNADVVITGKSAIGTDNNNRAGRCRRRCRRRCSRGYKACLRSRSHPAVSRTRPGWSGTTGR